MVMLRTKINPQAVVTIQLIIPRLIMALVLITFSYAIAGLVIDLVYFVVAIFISALNTTGVIGNLTMALNWFVNPGFYKIFLTYMFIYINYTMDPVSLLLLFPSLLGLVMMVVVFFLLLRIWWMMMKAYITFMLLIIIGPWQIMLGVLPGRSGFASWFRNILAQASVFAVVPIVFIINLSLNSLDHFNYLAPFAELVTWIQANITYGGLTAGPSGAELPSFPLFHSPMSGFFVFLTTFAILALMPKIADMVRDAIKAPKFPYGSAFGEALGPVTAGLSLAGYAGAGSRAVGDALPAGKAQDLLRAYGTAVETISKKAEGAAKTLKNNI